MIDKDAQQKLNIIIDKLLADKYMYSMRAINGDAFLVSIKDSEKTIEIAFSGFELSQAIDVENLTSAKITHALQVLEVA